jgi:hypothetical protein
MRERKQKLLDAIYDLTYKDIGDFGGWHGLKEYCLDTHGDDAEVLMLVAFVDNLGGV